MRRVAILTSGGDAPGMNACLRACVRYAIHNDIEMYGVERGYVGLLNNRLERLNTRSVSDIIHRGGTVLKTARCPEFKEKEYILQAADTLKAYGIDSVIVIGGDGSFRGAKDLSDIGGINVVAIPGTIDNDLAYTDYTLGFDTAVNTVMSAMNNLRDTMSSHDRASMLEVMGRKAGDIALYSAVAGGAEYCIIPEVPYDLEEIARSMKQSIKRGKTSNMIVLAEGAGDREEICSKIKEIAGISVKTTTLGHIQRGGAPSMFDRVLAAKMAVRAVDLLLAGKTNRAIGIKNNQIIDMDITEALSMPHGIDENLYEVAHILSLHK
ncbi:MAG: 6-phosphofructokinase [Clostridia bacterium]|nr:6-phosphofructokinase [Clostridia bacterium]